MRDGVRTNEADAPDVCDPRYRDRSLFNARENEPGVRPSPESEPQ